MVKGKFTTGLFALGEGWGLHQAFQEALLYCVCVPVVFDQYGRAREAALPRLTEVGAQLGQQRKVAKYSR